MTVYRMAVVLILAILCAYVLIACYLPGCWQTPQLRRSCVSSLFAKHRMHAGDLILSSADQCSMVRYVQKIILSSPYTHISIVIHGGCTSADILILESVRTGVRVVSLQTYLLNARKYREECVVRQLHPLLSIEQQTKLQQIARESIGHQYAFSAWKALLYYWHPVLNLPNVPRVHVSNIRKTFCSQLIAHVYEQLGVARFFKPLDTVLPCDFADCVPRRFQLCKAYMLKKPWAL